MAQTADALQQASTHPPKSLRSSLGTVLLYGLGFAVLAYSYQGADIRPWALIEDSGNMATLGAEFFPPDFSQGATTWRRSSIRCRSRSGVPSSRSFSRFPLA
jgi:hypothetical protein